MDSGRNKTWLYMFFVVSVAGISAVAGAVMGGVAVYQAVKLDPPTALTALSITNPVEPITRAAAPAPAVIDISTTQINTTITQIVEKIGPSVVTVVAKGTVRSFGRASASTSTGSGVIISADGYLLTNNHVIEGMDTFSVVLFNGSERPAKLIGADQFADLAVLKVDGELPGVAALGNSDALKPGETVIAIGSPLGDFKNTVTVGVVSATGRSVDTGEGYVMEGLIQTDAAINQGNSGGPLLNLAGQVVGINTLILRSSSSGTVVEGLGFSVPSNTIQLVSNHIIQKGYVSRPYLGARTQDIDPSLARRYRLSAEYGAYVTEVIAGSPAQKAGIQVGDIITKINDLAIDEKRPFTNALFNFTGGETVTITLMRGASQMEFKVPLEESQG